MSFSPKPDELNPRVRTMQVLISALLIGVVSFLAIAVCVRVTGSRATPDPPLLTYAACGFAVLEGMVSLVLPRLLVASNRRRIAEGTWSPGPSRSGMPVAIPATDAGKLLMVWFTSRLIGAAVLEGGAFFFLIAYLVEGQPIAILGAVLLALGIAARFPTRGRLERWLETQQNLLAEQRLGGL